MTNPCEMPPEECLILDNTEGHDYTMSGEYVWITVGNTTIYIKRDLDQVCIEVSPLGQEDQQIAILTTTQPEINHEIQR